MYPNATMIGEPGVGHAMCVDTIRILAIRYIRS